MDGTQMKAALKAFGEDAKLEVLTTTQKLYHNYKGSYIGFNDEKEMYTSVRINQDEVTFVQKPFEVSCGTYEDISCIVGIGTYEETVMFLTNFVSGGIITAADKEKMIKAMDESGAADTYATTTSVQNVKDRVGVAPRMYDAAKYENKERVVLDEPKVGHKSVSTDGTVKDI